MMDLSHLKFDSQGLIPAVIQDWLDGSLLMLAYMNPESIKLSLDKKSVHFWNYERKRNHYCIAHSSSYDPDLKRLFSDDPVHSDKISAASFLNQFRREVRRKVAAWTGEYQYTIDQVLEDMIQRCRELHLHLSIAEEQAKLDFTILLTVHTMNYLRSGRHKVAV